MQSVLKPPKTKKKPSLEQDSLITLIVVGCCKKACGESNQFLSLRKWPRKESGLCIGDSEFMPCSPSLPPCPFKGCAAKLSPKCKLCGGVGGRLEECNFSAVLYENCSLWHQMALLSSCFIMACILSNTHGIASMDQGSCVWRAHWLSATGAGEAAKIFLLSSANRRVVAG